MIIRALAPWYGCKRGIAPHIVRQFGRHNVYWEPFCASMSILFTKEQASYESVNDLHSDLINLARVVQNEDYALDLYGRVQRTLFTEDMVVQARNVLSHPWNTANGDNPNADVGRAYWYMVFSWMGLNGVSGTPLSKTGTFAVRYTQGGNGPVRWRSVAESIPDWHRRLQRVQILQRDAFEIIPRIEDVEGCAIYCDPPYFSKTTEYVHDFDPNDHDRLWAQLDRFKRARVLVSYYDCKEVRDLYDGWTFVPIRAAKAMANSSKRQTKGRTEADEVLIINGPSFGPEPDPTLF